MIVNLEQRLFKATLTVSYPSGTCTVSLGGISYTHSGGGSHTFTLRKKGTWTVTATDGSKSDGATVIISQRGQAESLSLAYDLTIFDGGDNTALTGGWGNSSQRVFNPVAAGSTLAISFDASNSSMDYGTFVFTKNKIDLSKLSALEAVISQYNHKSGEAWNFVISSSNTPSTTDWVTGNFGTAKTSITRTGTYSLDVSRYSGQYYVGFFTCLVGKSGLTVRLSATKISGS